MVGAISSAVKRDSFMWLFVIRDFSCNDFSVNASVK